MDGIGNLFHRTIGDLDLLDVEVQEARTDQSQESHYGIQVDVSRHTSFAFIRYGLEPFGDRKR